MLAGVHACAFEERRIPHICPHTTIYVSSYYFICFLILLQCVVILLYMCPHTTMCPRTTKHVSSCYHATTCVLMLLHESSCYNICVLILLYVLVYMCPHTTIHYYRALLDTVVARLRRMMECSYQVEEEPGSMVGVLRQWEGRLAVVLRSSPAGAALIHS
jgi:hypothetical protein